MPDTPKTPLMIDADLVEIKRHLRRAVDVAMTLDVTNNAEHHAVAKALTSAYTLTSEALDRHRTAFNLGTPNH